MNSRLNKLSYFLKIASEDEPFIPRLSPEEESMLGAERPGSSFKHTPSDVFNKIRERTLERRRNMLPELEPGEVLITPGETLDALKNNPKILEWFEYIRGFVIPENYKYVVMVPCSASKPWGELSSPGSAKYYKSYWDVIKNLREDEKDNLVYWVTVSEPLGIVPQDDWDNFPAYDNPGLFRDPAQRSGLFTRDWKELYGEKYILPFDEKAREEAIQILGDVIGDFFQRNNIPGRKWISLVGGTKGKVSTHTEMIDIALNFLEKGGCEIPLTRKPKMVDAPGRPSRSGITEYTEESIRELLNKESRLNNLLYFLKISL